MSEPHPHVQRVEAMAKLIAAALMGLRKDAIGAELPEDCWRKMLPKAEATLFILTNGNAPFAEYHGIEG